MILSAVVAVTEDNAIGKEGGIPWYLPADLAHMRDVTMGHPIIMGRKTHESIGRTLPGRTNIVISRNPAYQVFEGSLLVSSLEEALSKEDIQLEDEVFIFGGQEIYDQAMPQLQRIYLTRVHAKIPADKFFNYHPSQWQQISIEEHKADDKNQYDYDFCVLEKIQP
nr:Dihydrofolate reductase [uncultured bacterium]